jgi:hypothetical protein
LVGCRDKSLVQGAARRAGLQRAHEVMTFADKGYEVNRDHATSTKAVP